MKKWFIQNRLGWKGTMAKPLERPDALPGETVWDSGVCTLSVRSPVLRAKAIIQVGSWIH